MTSKFVGIVPPSHRHGNRIHFAGFCRIKISRRENIRGKDAQTNTIRYALARWPAPCRFLDDGRIELDNNPVERAIRPVALGRKNHLFAGSDGGGERWAMVCSLIATARLDDVEPFAYIRDVLQRMRDGLLPWHWTPKSVNP